MNKPNKFSPEARERAVRMVQEHRGEYPAPLYETMMAMLLRPAVGHAPSSVRKGSLAFGETWVSC